MAAALRRTLAGSPVHDANCARDCARDCAWDAALVMVRGSAQVPKPEARGPSAEANSCQLGVKNERAAKKDIKDKRAAALLTVATCRSIAIHPIHDATPGTHSPRVFQQQHLQNHRSGRLTWHLLFCLQGEWNYQCSALGQAD